jgi:hypothetical protein
MFAPNQEQAVAELVRVTRTGGRIALASWTPPGPDDGTVLAAGEYLEAVGVRR